MELHVILHAVEGRDDPDLIESFAREARTEVRPISVEQFVYVVDVGVPAYILHVRNMRQLLLETVVHIDVPMAMSTSSVRGAGRSLNAITGRSISRSCPSFGTVLLTIHASYPSWLALVEFTKEDDML
jgi:hypothetical protein